MFFSHCNAVSLIPLLCIWHIALGELTHWTTLETRLPFTTSYHACGYDNDTNNIWIYYGLSGNWNGVASYDPETSLIKHSYPAITPLSQFFATKTYIGSPYWYFMSNDQFGQFHPSNHCVTYPLPWNNNNVPVPTSVNLPNEQSCATISNDGNYIIILGGWNGSYYNGNAFVRVLSNMQIYDIRKQQWKLEGPHMNYQRTQHGCIVDRNNYLYAIGGGYSNSRTSIERIKIDNIENNIFGDWALIGTLSEGKGEVKTIEYGDYIYVIGGYRGSTNGYTTNVVERIDIITATVTSQQPLLPKPITATCLTLVNNKIYIIAGENVNYDTVGTLYYDSIIVSNDLLYNSTDHPTINPLNEPSVEPSIEPSSSPSINTTNEPSNYPTNEPSNYPTNELSNYPTNEPSNYPTNEASEILTMAPTIDEHMMTTIYPTINTIHIESTYNPGNIYSTIKSQREYIWNNKSVVIAIIICITAIIITCILLIGFIIYKRSKIHQENDKMRCKLNQTETDNFEMEYVAEGVELQQNTTRFE